MDWNQLLQEKNNVFKLNDFNSKTSSAWVSYQNPDQGRIRLLHSLEDYRQNPELLLNEFCELEASQKERLRPFLNQWLHDNELNNSSDNRQEVRDFIYEMF